MEASEIGRGQIKAAITAKNWQRTGKEALKAANKHLGCPPGISAYGVSISTWKRFVAGKSIRRDTFEIYCQVLGLDWKDIANQPDLKPSRDDLWWMPVMSNFYGRTQELSELSDLLLNYRFVILWGLGGIGKTTITVRLVDRVKSQFDRCIWREFDHNLPIEQLLLHLLHSLSDTNQAAPCDSATLKQLLSQKLEAARTLIVLDEVNRGNGRATLYQELIETLQELGRRQHQSCILLTTRERLADFTAVMGGRAISYSLQGLDPQAGCQILTYGQLIFEPEIGKQLVRQYRGNPLALELVCPIVREDFQYRVDQFLASPKLYVPSTIEQMLRQQIRDLSEFERAILRPLAHSEPLSLLELQEKLSENGDLIQALYRLGRRSLIEKVAEDSNILYTLQPIILEFVRRYL